MSADSDYPQTEPLRPSVPVAPSAPPLAHPAAAAVAAGAPLAYEPIDAGWLTRLEDRVRSLSSLVAFVAVLAVAALGLSIYDLVHNGGDRRGASQQRVARLSDRVSRLEGKSSTAADASTTSSLASRLDQKASAQDLQKLSDQVAQLRTTAASSAGGADPAALTQLSTRVDKLAQQIADVSSKTTTAP